MISKFSGLILVLLVSTTISATTPAATTPREGIRSSKAIEQEGSSSQELTEAGKLEREVVKLYKEGKYDDAMPLAKRVVKIRERVLPANAPLLADGLSNLAMVYLARKKFDDAESLFQRALAIYEQNPAVSGLLLANTLDSLAQLRLFKRDIRAAEKFYMLALAAKEKSLSPDHEEILYSLNTLVDFHVSNRDYGAANSMLKRIIAIKEQKLGDSDMQVGRLLERMACLMYRDRRNAEAEKVEARANHILYGGLAILADPIQLPNQVFSCKLINNPRPDFVSVAKARRFSGPLVMDVAVEADEAGNVTSARLIGGDPAFKSVAEKAALNAKLRPTLVDGRAVKVGGVISHQFMTMTRTVIVAVPAGGMRP